MRNATRKIVAKPAATNASAKRGSKAAKPVTTAAPIEAKPEPVATLPVTDAAPAVAVAKPSGNITRTAKTIVAAATNFGNLSDRDTAYITFYAGLAKRNGGTVTLADIVASGARPAYIGSNKPHDAGVINRLNKAGLVSSAADGHSFAFTDKAATLAAYIAG